MNRFLVAVSAAVAHIKPAIFALLAAVVCVSSACSDNSAKSASPGTTTTTTTATASPQHLLDTLKEHGIQPSSDAGTGYLDDNAIIKAGQVICDSVRRGGAMYDPVPLIKLLYKLSDESSRAFYKASRDNLCPDVPAYVPSPLTRPTPNTIPGQGTFPVGIEVQPGTYVSQPLATGKTCIWLRLRDERNNRASVINEGSEVGSVTVTILPTDVAFESSGCETWRKIS